MKLVRRFLMAAVVANVTLAQQTIDFESASVKLSPVPKDGRFRVGPHFEPGAFIGEYMTMRDLVITAYNVPAGGKVVGQDWIDSDSARYFITAKAPGRASTKELQSMLQRLLEARFGLKLHQERRAAPVYALVVSGKGLKLSPVKFDGDEPNKGAIHYSNTGVEFQHTSVKLLASFLAIVGRPVRDETGTTDLYDFKLVYANRGGLPLLDPLPANASDETAPGSSDLPTIFAALQSIGLRLENRQGEVTDLIIDRVERVPTEN
jgi:uncharacterized protein (TIGR03435 family)